MKERVTGQGSRVTKKKRISETFCFLFGLAHDPCPVTHDPRILNARGHKQ